MNKNILSLIFFFAFFFNISSQEDCSKLLDKKIEFRDSIQFKIDLELLINCGLQKEDLNRPFLNQLVIIDLNSSDNVASLTYKDLIDKYAEVKKSKSYIRTENDVKFKVFIINSLVVLSLIIISFLLYLLIKKIYKRFF